VKSFCEREDGELHPV